MSKGSIINLGRYWSITPPKFGPKCLLWHYEQTRQDYDEIDKCSVEYPVKARVRIDSRTRIK